MAKRTSYKTNSWWNHRMVGSSSPDRNIDTWEDKRQDAYLEKLEKSLGTSRKKIQNPSRSPRK